MKSELDLRSQAELLLAIETKTFYPVGSTRKQTSDFRLICATNKDLQKMVQEGAFREDLYTRIRCWEFLLPGIRDLPKDFQDNVDHEMKQNNSEEFHKGNAHPFQVFFEDAAKASYNAFGISPEALWTGNFRDLKFSIRRLATKARLRESSITLEMVLEEIDHLRKIWGYPKQKTEANPDEILATLERMAHSQYSDRNLLDALESYLLTLGFEKYGNKAKTAKWLYETPGKSLVNPSNRFRERFKSLFPQ